MNRRQILAITAGILSLATGIFAVRVFWFSPGPIPAEPEPPLPPAEEFSLQDKRLSGPYTHKNLAVYLVHGDDTLKGRTPLTLEEAMDRKLVVVHETGEVTELAIENLSPKDEVFVHAGDIVKGGQQDRVLAVDLIVPARSGRMPIDSFCVEQGRWTARGTESRREFNSSTEYAPSKEIKIAARQSKSQSDVWAGVEKSQEKLSAATNTNTASSVSRSSLPLTLENQRVRADSAEYLTALSRIVDGKSDVIGFLFTINGEINSSDIYGSTDLFQKLWPRLLKAAAIEAVAETEQQETKTRKASHAGLAEIESFFRTAETAAVAEERTITDRIRMITRDSGRSVFIETLDRGTMLHRSYIFK